MIFNNFSSRNLYPQDDIFNFYIETQSNNISGVSTFGFSGNGQNIDFKFGSGQIYLNSPQNLFLSSYAPNQLSKISGNIGINSYDLYINDIPYCVGLNKNTGYYNTFYVNSQNVETSLSLNINGESPNYSYDPFESYYSGQIIPLSITNSGSYPFKIFSGEVLNNSNFTLSGITNVSVTGTKILNLIANNFIPIQQQVPISLYTNFGNIQLSFSASGIPVNDGQFYLFFGPDNKSIVSQVPNDYIVTIKSFTGVQLFVGLEYVSGATGNYYRNILNTGFITGGVSGFITGSGVVKSLKTGLLSKYNPLSSSIETGVGTGYLENFIIASGTGSGNFSIPMTGLGSGLINHDVPVTGTGLFTFQGTINPNGGYLTATGLTGYGSGQNQYGLYTGYTNQGIATVFVPYTGASVISGFFNSNQYETVNFVSDLFFFTGLITKTYSINGLAWATGEIVTGKLQGEFGYNFEPGVYTFSKTWTGLASGESAIIDSFNPTEYTYGVTGTSGVINGTYYTVLDVNGCNFDEPFLTPTGTPSQIYNKTGGIVSPLQIFVLTPLNTGEYTGENSFNNSSRTNISRRGNTPSGTGYFNNVFQQPFYRDGIWTETLTGITGKIFTAETGKIKSITANPFLYNDVVSGYFRVSGDFTGYQSFVWGGQTSGDFSDYTTFISGIDNSLRKTYTSSYNFEMLLKTGTYAFFLYPSVIETGVFNTESPFISYPSQVDVFENENNIMVPFQLLYPSNSTVKMSFEYQEGTAREYINYLPTQKEITFNGGQSGLQFLTIPIIDNSIQNNNSVFGLKITNISGGYISNRGSLINTVININILDNDIPTESNSCCDPTGIDVTPACLKYIGGKIYSGYNGIYYNTIVFDSAVKNNEVLNFKTRFVAGLSDDLIIIGLVANSNPITIIDTRIQNYVSGSLINVNETLSLPSNTFAIKTEVIAASASSNQGSRCPWYLVLGCAEQNDRLNNIENQILNPLTACYGSQLSPFDFAVIRFIWDSDGGTDLDIRVALMGVDASINGRDVGWDREDVVAGVSGNYLIWGGEDTGSGGTETALVYFDRVSTDFPALSTISVRLRANWYSSRNTGNFTIQFETWVGGIMSRVSTNFINTGGEQIDIINVEANVVSNFPADVDGDGCGTLIFNVATNTAEII